MTLRIVFWLAALVVTSVGADARRGCTPSAPLLSCTTLHDLYTRSPCNGCRAMDVSPRLALIDTDTHTQILDQVCSVACGALGFAQTWEHKRDALARDMDMRVTSALSCCPSLSSRTLNDQSVVQQYLAVTKAAAILEQRLQRLEWLQRHFSTETRTLTVRRISVKKILQIPTLAEARAPSRVRAWPHGSLSSPSVGLALGVPITDAPSSSGKQLKHSFLHGERWDSQRVAGLHLYQLSWLHGRDVRRLVSTHLAHIIGWEDVAAEGRTDIMDVQFNLPEVHASLAWTRVRIRLETALDRSSQSITDDAPGVLQGTTATSVFWAQRDVTWTSVHDYIRHSLSSRRLPITLGLYGVGIHWHQVTVPTWGHGPTYPTEPQWYAVALSGTRVAPHPVAEVLVAIRSRLRDWLVANGTPDGRGLRAGQYSPRYLPASVGVGGKEDGSPRTVTMEYGVLAQVDDTTLRAWFDQWRTGPMAVLIGSSAASAPVAHPAMWLGIQQRLEDTVADTVHMYALGSAPLHPQPYVSLSADTTGASQHFISAWPTVVTAARDVAWQAVPPSAWQTSPPFAWLSSISTARLTTRPAQSTDDSQPLLPVAVQVVAYAGREYTLTLVAGEGPGSGLLAGQAQAQLAIGASHNVTIATQRVGVWASRNILAGYPNTWVVAQADKGVCPPGRFGPTCRWCSSCSHPDFPTGTCNEGYTGDGECTCTTGWNPTTTVQCSDCLPNHFGSNCEPCSACAKGGTCKAGWTQDGSCICSGANYNPNTRCTTCVSDHYGTTCTKCDPCQNNGTCRDGISGNGLCTCAHSGLNPSDRCASCLPGYFGSACTQCAACSNGGECQDGYTGDGSCTCSAPGFDLTSRCTECRDGYYGSTCTQCLLCYNESSCRDGVAGDGTCACSSAGFDPATRCAGCRVGYYTTDCGATFSKSTEVSIPPYSYVPTTLRMPSGQTGVIVGNPIDVAFSYVQHRPPVFRLIAPVRLECNAQACNAVMFSRFKARSAFDSWHLPECAFCPRRMATSFRSFTTTTRFQVFVPEHPSSYNVEWSFDTPLNELSAARAALFYLPLLVNPVHSRIVGYRSGDLDNDGLDDVLVVRSRSLGWYNQISDPSSYVIQPARIFRFQYLATGFNDLSSSYPFADPNFISERMVAIGDVDGDGYQDVVLSSRMVVPTQRTYRHILIWCRNRGLQTPTTIFSSGPHAFAFEDAIPIDTELECTQIELADIDSDGLLDIVCFDSQTSRFVFLHQQRSGTQLQWKQWVVVDPSISGMQSCDAFTIADVDKDGVKDIVFLPRRGWRLLVFSIRMYGAASTGPSFALRYTHSFFSLNSIAPVQRWFTSIQRIDIDNDGEDDDYVVVASDDDGRFTIVYVIQLEVHLSEWGGPDILWTAYIYRIASTNAGKFFAADVNKDDKPDLVVYSNGANAPSLSIWTQSI